MTSVLVLEDDAFCKEIAELALRRAGITDIAFASDGATGLRMLDRMQPRPDLILCDIFMPEMDGIEIVNALVERKFAGGLILVTGADTQFLQVAKTMAQEAGLRYLDAICKPLTDEALAPLLERLGRS
jgi:CheY-like chemotaxis protein